MPHSITQVIWLKQEKQEKLSLSILSSPGVCCDDDDDDGDDNGDDDGDSGDDVDGGGDGGYGDTYDFLSSPCPAFLAHLLLSTTMI